MKFNTENFIEIDIVSKILKQKNSKIIKQLQSLNEFTISIAKNGILLLTVTQLKQLIQKYYPHFNIDKALKHL